MEGAAAAAAADDDGDVGGGGSGGRSAGQRRRGGHDRHGRRLPVQERALPKNSLGSVGLGLVCFGMDVPLQLSFMSFALLSNRI